MKYLKKILVYFTSFPVCSGDIKKSSENDSENDKSTGHFQRFFLPPTLNIQPFKLVHVNRCLKYTHTHTGKCIRRLAGIYAYCRHFIDTMFFIWFKHIYSYFHLQ